MASSDGIEYTARGFGIYARICDNRGHEIRVQESSAADGAYVWIFTSVGIDNGSDPHLSIENARVIRDAPNTFIQHRGAADDGQ